MNIKKMFGALAAGAASLPVMAAEGDIDISAVTTAGTKIQTALTSFFTSTLIPLITAVGGVALAAYLVLVIFKWARKLGK